MPGTGPVHNQSFTQVFDFKDSVLPTLVLARIMNPTLSMSMNLSDCYRILNVSQGVRWEEIRKAYYRLARLFHPDRNPEKSDGETRFKEATLAFKILEAHYKTRHQGHGGTASLVTISRPEKVSGKREERPIFAEPLETPEVQLPKAFLNGENEEDSISSFFSKMADKLLQYERKLFLLDIHKEITIDPATAANGGVVRVRKGKESFQVKIPSGLWNKMSLRISGKGEPSLFGKKRGDLVLNIQVAQKNPVFAGESLFFYDIQIPKLSVSKSRVLTLDSVHGPIKFIVPKNTKTGQAFVLKSQSKADELEPSNHIVTLHLV